MKELSDFIAATEAKDLPYEERAEYMFNELVRDEEAYARLSPGMVLAQCKAALSQYYRDCRHVVRKPNSAHGKVAARVSEVKKKARPFNVRAAARMATIRWMDTYVLGGRVRLGDATREELERDAATKESSSATLSRTARFHRLLASKLRAQQKVKDKFNERKLAKAWEAVRELETV